MSLKPEHRTIPALRAWRERALAEERKKPEVIHLYIGCEWNSGEDKRLPAMRQWANDRKAWEAGR